MNLDNNLPLEQKQNEYYGDVIISSYPYSGVSWVMNILIELNICVNITNDNYKLLKWNFNDENIASLVKEDDFNWSAMIPALNDKSEFVFKENLLVSTTHNTPNLENLKNNRVILMVRDPRDTILSIYKSKITNNEKSLSEFFTDIRSLEFGYIDKTLNFWITKNKNNQLISIFDLIHRWVIFYGLWINCISNKNLFLIKLEDTKINPEKVVRELLIFLNINRSDEEIKIAISKSTFENAKKNEDKNSISKIRHFNSGIRGKWKKEYLEDDLKYFEGLPYKMMSHFGYNESNPIGNSILTYEEILSTFKEIKSPQLKRILTLLESINDNVVLKDFSSNVIKNFIEMNSIKKRLNNKVKYILLITNLSIKMTLIYSNNTNNLDFTKELNKNEFLIFKSLFSLFYDMSLDNLENISKKTHLDNLPLTDFLV